MARERIDISTLSEAELDALQLDRDGAVMPQQAEAERWWIGAIIATVVILILMGLLGFAKGAATTRDEMREHRPDANRIMGSGH